VGSARQQREGRIEYNYKRGSHAMDAATQVPAPVSDNAAMTGTDAATYTRERPGMSAFVLEDGVVYHTYSTYARGLDGLWGMYQWLDRAPRRRNETGIRGATRRVSGGAAMTSTPGDELMRGDISPRMVSELASERAFFGVSALLVAASADCRSPRREVALGSQPLMQGGRFRANS
jgi:hypothetical protein